MKALKAFILTLVIVLCAGLGYLVYSNKLVSFLAARFARDGVQAVQEAVKEQTDKVVEEALNHAIETIVAGKLAEAGIPQDKAEELIDKVSEEDKSKVTQIVSEHLDRETIQEIGSLAGGDSSPEEIAEYVEEKLTPQEYDQIEQLVKKYALELMIP